MVFGEAPQVQLPPSIPSISNFTVTIHDEDEDEDDEDPGKTITLEDFCRDEGLLSVSAPPVLCEQLGVRRVYRN